MRDAALQGLHFRYAETPSEILLEVKKKFPIDDAICTCCGRPNGKFEERFFYWLKCADGMKLIHASGKKNINGIQTVGERFIRKVPITTP